MNPDLFSHRKPATCVISAPAAAAELQNVDTFLLLLPRARMTKQKKGRECMRPGAAIVTAGVQHSDRPTDRSCRVDQWTNYLVTCRLHRQQADQCTVRYRSS